MPTTPNYAALAQAVRRAIRAELDDEAAIAVPMLGACHNALSSRLTHDAAIAQPTAEDDVRAIARGVIHAAAFLAFAGWVKDGVVDMPKTDEVATRGGEPTNSASGYAWAIRGMIDAMAEVLRGGIEGQIAPVVIHSVGRVGASGPLLGEKPDDPIGVVVTFNGAKLEGFAPGDSITIERSRLDGVTGAVTECPGAAGSNGDGPTTAIAHPQADDACNKCGCLRPTTPGAIEDAGGVTETCHRTWNGALCGGTYGARIGYGG